MNTDHFFEAELKSDKSEVFVIRSSSAPTPVSSQTPTTRRWVPPGTSVNVQRYSLPDGLVFLCDNAERSRFEQFEPSMIDESLPIGREDDFTVRHLPYYPTYGDASPTARAAYLNWLARGRRHPQADLGYVYLFFYGLERRVVIDARTDPTARDDVPAICTELKGLIGTYRNGTFNLRARQLLEFCCYIYGIGDLSLPSLPLDCNPHVVKDPLRFALSLAYHERRELPAKLLVTWYLNEGRFQKPPVVKRHKEMFAAVFQDLCDRQFHSNLATWTPSLKTKNLQLSYKPVSMALREVQETMPVLDLTSREAGLGRLVEAIALSAAEELGRYSRYIARNGEHAQDPVAHLMLPCPLWPGPIWERLALILADLSAGVEVTEPTTLSAFLAPLDAADVLSSIPVAKLLGQMENYMSIGVEPDPRHSAIAVGTTTPIVFFRSGDLPLPELSRAKSTDLLPLHLKHHARAACVMFIADLIRTGLPDSHAAIEQAKTITHGWDGLTSDEHVRLQALLIALTAPESPLFKGKSALRKQLELIDPPYRESLSHELVEIARAGGALEEVSVVRVLEKYFALLGADPKSLYDIAHTSMGPDACAASPHTTTSHGEFDTARIHALRKETAEVDDVLGSIFMGPEDEPADKLIESTPAPRTAPVHLAATDVLFAALPALDVRHSALLRALLVQDAWTSAALAAVCAMHALMPSGAVERINDAAFDAFDEALLEGDNPIEINPHLLAELRN